MKTNVRHHLRRTKRSGVVPVIRHSRNVAGRDRSEKQAITSIHEASIVGAQMMKDKREAIKYRQAEKVFQANEAEALANAENDEERQAIEDNGVDDGTILGIDDAFNPVDYQDTKLNYEMNYVKIDGWRGYYEPKDSALGISDTGMADDSPSPSNKTDDDLKKGQRILQKHGIPSEIVTTRSSNVFMALRSVVVPHKDLALAKRLLKKIQEE